MDHKSDVTAEAKKQINEFSLQVGVQIDSKDSKSAPATAAAGSKGKDGTVEVSERPLADYSVAKGVAPIRCDVRQRRILKGHFSRIYSTHWASDSRHLVSASQDGKLIIWNAFTCNKIHAIPLKNSWVMSAAFAPGASNRLVACGGLDNLVTVFRVPDHKVSPVYSRNDHASAAAQKAAGPHAKIVYAELSQHEGYVSCIRFIGDDELLSTSGDGTAVLWDTDTRTAKKIFNPQHPNGGGSADLMCCEPFLGTGGGSAASGATTSGGGLANGSPAGHGSTLFCVGSCDATAYLIDTRTDAKGGTGVVSSFIGHESDINCVSWFPDGTGFASGGDDSTMRLWDLRSNAQLNRYDNDRILCSITSCAFSMTGRILFGGYDDYNVYGWDSQLGSLVAELRSHENRISAIGVSRDGKALSTASWDTLIRIWA